MTASARLDALTRAAALLCQADDNDVQQIGEAMVDWLNGGAARLDDALGLRAGPGRSSWQTQVAIERRNQYLREAAERFGLGAADLALGLARYESSSWRRERTQAECPERLNGKPQAYYWRALHSWPRTVSERQVRNIISEIKGPVSFPPTRATSDVR